MKSLLCVEHLFCFPITAISRSKHLYLSLNQNKIKNLGYSDLNPSYLRKRRAWMQGRASP